MHMHENVHKLYRIFHTLWSKTSPIFKGYGSLAQKLWDVKEGKELSLISHSVRGLGAPKLMSMFFYLHMTISHWWTLNMREESVLAPPECIYSASESFENHNWLALSSKRKFVRIFLVGNCMWNIFGLLRFFCWSSLFREKHESSKSQSLGVNSGSEFFQVPAPIWEER